MMDQVEEMPYSIAHLGDSSYANHLSASLHQLRHQGLLCDVDIIVGNQKFQAHKLVLSCASQYFRSMFTSAFLESSSTEVNVPGTSQCFTQLIQFAYTGYFDLSHINITGIFSMVCYMQFTQAVDICARYLIDNKSKISMDDCFEVWSLSENFGESVSELCMVYRGHLVHNFIKLKESHNFLEHASGEFILECLQDEYIETDVSTEIQIFGVVMAWLKFNWNDRHVHMVKLLTKVRLGLVAVETLEAFLEDPDIGRGEEYRKLVAEVIDLHQNNNGDEIYTEWFTTRNTITSDHIYAIGGVGLDGYPVTNVERYSMFDRQWKPVANLRRPVKSPSVVDFDDCLVLCGFNEWANDFEITIQIYKPNQNSWYLPYELHEPLQDSMDIEPYSALLTVQNGDLYFIYLMDKPGDINIRKPKVYKVLCNFSIIPPTLALHNIVQDQNMPETKIKALSIKAFLKIGSKLNGSFYFDERDSYSAGCWKMLHRMATLPYPSHGNLTDFSLVAVNGALYAAGGESKYSTIERGHSGRPVYRCTTQCMDNFCTYDARNNKWIQLPPMINKRKSFSMIGYDDHIYVIGGVGLDGYPVTNVERYSMFDRQWKPVANLRRPVKSASVVDFDDCLVLCGFNEWANDFEITIQIYKPNQNSWYLPYELHEPLQDSMDIEPYSALLTVQNGDLYFIYFMDKPGDIHIRKPKVYKVLCNFSIIPPTLALHNIVQDQNMPETKIKALSIKGKVFICKYKYVQQIQVKRYCENNTYDLSRWQNIGFSGQGSVVPFTFDKRPLLIRTM